MSGAGGVAGGILMIFTIIFFSLSLSVHRLLSSFKLNESFFDSEMLCNKSFIKLKISEERRI